MEVAVRFRQREKSSKPRGAASGHARRSLRGTEQDRLARVRPQPVVEQNDYAEGNRATVNAAAAFQPTSFGENITP